MNTSFDTFITTYGWVGLGFTVLGLLVSSLTLAYYTGYKRGGGEWRGRDMFAPRPIIPNPDMELVDEIRSKKIQIDNLHTEVARLKKVHANEIKRWSAQIEKLQAQIPEKPKPAQTRTRSTSTKKVTA